VIITLGGAFFTIFGVLLLIEALYILLRGPLLKLSPTGISTPWTGAVPWENVRGISLRPVKFRGISMFHQIWFRISSLSRANKSNRLLDLLPSFRTLRKGQLRINLIRASEHPEVVSTLARKLWTQRTSLDHEWVIDGSNEVNDALEKLGSIRSEGLPTEPSELLAQAEAVRASLEVLQSDARKRRRRFYLAFLITVVLIGAWFLLKLGFSF
jgi:hypothetical protein